jgi:hypothetical protein
VFAIRQAKLSKVAERRKLRIEVRADQQPTMPRIKNLLPAQTQRRKTAQSDSTRPGPPQGQRLVGTTARPQALHSQPTTTSTCRRLTNGLRITCRRHESASRRVGELVRPGGPLYYIPRSCGSGSPRRR